MTSLVSVLPPEAFYINRPDRDRSPLWEKKEEDSTSGMKIILTGVTGFVGSHVLEASIASPAISSVLVLTRRPIQDEALRTHPKVTEIIHTDFAVYPKGLMERLKGAQACIWYVSIYYNITYPHTPLCDNGPDYPHHDN